MCLLLSALRLLLLHSVCQYRVVVADVYRKAPCEYTNNQSDLNSFLWTLMTDPPSYFFGTIHVPYTRVWDFIPDNSKEAFYRAENVYFELDLTDPYTISALANCQLLPRGEYLSNVLPKDIYRRLKRHLDYVKLMMPTWMTADQRGRGLYADYLFNAITGNWERKRPVWVMLMVNSLTESDVRARGIPVLDLYLAQEAERMNKQTGAVEKVEEQCVPLNELNFSQVLFALNQTLWQHESYRQGAGSMPYTTDDLIRHYNCGDLNSIIFDHDTAQVPNLVNNSLPQRELITAKNIDEYFRDELIYKRNQRMADQVTTLLERHPNESFFFAFGAGHFLGNNTVIDKLKERGFLIQHTQAHEDLYVGSRWKLKKRRKNQYYNPLTHMSADYPLPSLGDHLDPFYDRRRHRHRHKARRKGRRRDRHRQKTPVIKRPHFNDLWVRLESTSFGAESLLWRQAARTSTQNPQTRYKLYSGHSTHATASLLSLFLAALSLCYHSIL